MPPQVETEPMDTDLQQEYMRQREYLERNVTALKKARVKDQEIHQAAYRRMLRVISLFFMVWKGKEGSSCTKETLVALPV